MMIRKKKGKVALLVASIFTLVSALFMLFEFIIMAFNLWGLADLYCKLIDTYLGGENASQQITMMCIELSVSILIDLYLANFYYNGYRHNFGGPAYGRSLIIMGILQLISSSLIPGIIVLIVGLNMMSSKTVASTPKGNVATLQDYKLIAMSEAITRLKELRASGAISEEEYYANLNKIIEG